MLDIRKPFLNVLGRDLVNVDGINGFCVHLLLPLYFGSHSYTECYVSLFKPAQFKTETQITYVIS